MDNGAIIPAMLATIVGTVILLDRFAKSRIFRDFIPAWAVIPSMGVIIILDYAYTGDFIPR